VSIWALSADAKTSALAPWVSFREFRRGREIEIDCGAGVVGLKLSAQQGERGFE